MQVMLWKADIRISWEVRNQFSVLQYMVSLGLVKTCKNNSLGVMGLNNIWLLLCSSHRRHFDLKTTNHGPLFALMHHIVTGDDAAVIHGKPSPDIFLIAAARFEVLNFYYNILLQTNTLKEDLIFSKLCSRNLFL